METVKPTVRVYAGGGAGLNLGQKIQSPHVDVVYLDSSQANDASGIDPEKRVYIEGVKGSGSVRQHNYQVIAKEIPRYLEHFPPLDFNIVLGSASGGTGSVSNMLIMSQLMEQGVPVVAVLIGADDTERRTDNTIATLKTLEAISAKTNRPAVVCYHENYKGARSHVDENVVFNIEVLAQLASQTNAELDHQDIVNFVYYNQAVPVGHQLSSLTIHLTRKEASSVVEPISVASLYEDPDLESAFGNPHYNTVGFTDQIPTGDQIHFVINHADVERIYTHLQERKSELTRIHTSYTQRKSIVDRDDDMLDDGMVF